MKTNRNASKALVTVLIISLTLVAVCIGIMAFEFISGIELPDTAKRIIGIVDLIALPVAVFTGIRIRTTRAAQA